MRLLGNELPEVDLAIFRSTDLAEIVGVSLTKFNDWRQLRVYTGGKMVRDTHARGGKRRLYSLIDVVRLWLLVDAARYVSRDLAKALADNEEVIARIAEILTLPGIVSDPPVFPSEPDRCYVSVRVNLDTEVSVDFHQGSWAACGSSFVVPLDMLAAVAVQAVLRYMQPDAWNKAAACNLVA